MATGSKSKSPAYTTKNIDFLFKKNIDNFLSKVKNSKSLKGKCDSPNRKNGFSQTAVEVITE